MTALPEGFIPHDGGRCPVDRWKIVSIVTRSGRTLGPLVANHWDWWSSDHPGDIIAYRPTQQETK